MAVYNPVRICNMALNSIGITQKVEDLDDATDHLAVTCKDWYDICRDRSLAAFGWPFSKVRVALALVETFTVTGDPDGEWRFSYRRPNNCIVARRIVSGLRPEDAPVPFEAGQDGTGGLIFTDQENAVLEMSATLDDPGEWPDVFAAYVSADLAVEVAGPLRVPRDKKDGAKADRSNALIRAQGVANAERAIGPAIVSKYVTARGGAPRDPTCNWRR